MASYNKVILMGNLTRDPQLSYLPSQTPVVDLGLAVNRKWKDQQNQQRESVCFIDCRAYGKQAEIFKQYVKKGDPVFIEGRLKLDQWVDQSGQKRSKHKIIVERFQFLAQKPQDAPQATNAPPQAPTAPPPSPMPPSPPQFDSNAYNEANPDPEIPF